MEKVVCSLALIFFSSFSFAVSTVSSVDLQRYLGRWYEIASIPQTFQKKCVKNVTAEYSPLDFGKIDVTNSCERADGKLQVAHGIAKVVNHRTNAELKVSFVPLFNHFGWFAGQYKILILDQNYNYAVVGEDHLKYGWILSRTPGLPANTVIELEKNIRALGYNTCQFLTTVQEGGVFTDRVPLCQLVKD